MNLEDYKEWLKRNANKEEEKAYEVAKEILDYHRYYWEVEGDLMVKVFPRKVVVQGNERIEFDLVMVCRWTNYNRTYERTIGVEYKEYDVDKVIRQAIRRRDFVDYMYIATRDVTLDYLHVLYLAEFGIGWVTFRDDVVKLIIPSKFRYPATGIVSIIDYLAEKAVKEKFEKMLQTKLKNSNLSDFFSL